MSGTEATASLSERRSVCSEFDVTDFDWSFGSTWLTSLFLSNYILNKSFEEKARARIEILARRRPTRNYPFVSINRFFSEQSRAEWRAERKRSLMRGEMEGCS